MAVQADASGASGSPSSQASVPLLSDLRRMLFAQTPHQESKKEDDRLNVLLLGIGGAGHDGSNLTDTILIASIDLKDKRVGLVSIPRDLAYPTSPGRFEKINSLHAYAEQSHPGEGAKQTAEAFSRLFETKIDRVVRIDFQGFVKFIDALGGVDVIVETSFTDPQYPSNNPPNSWQTISFKKGAEHMSGERALMFARSRHGNNGEGTDFARSRRQQLVLLAVREKLLSLNTLADAEKLAKLYTAVNDHLQTDLSVWEVLKFAPLAREFDQKQMTLNVLSDGPDGLLVSGNVGGAYMLFPKKQDWSELKTIVQNPFETPTQRQNEQIPKEVIHLEVKNGTLRTNFAASVAAKLEKNGYEITNLGNAARRGYERSVIYDLTNGKKTTELARLKQLLNADTVSVPASSITASPDGPYRTFPIDETAKERLYSANADFLLVLGEASFSFAP